MKRALAAMVARGGVRLWPAAALFAGVGCTALLGLEDLSGPDGGAASPGSGAEGGTTSPSAGGAGGVPATAGGNGGGGMASGGSSAGGGPSCETTLTVLAEGEPLPGRVAVNDTHVFWIVVDNGSVLLREAQKDGGGSAENVDGYPDGNPSDALAATGNVICWGKNRGDVPVEVACRTGTGQGFLSGQLPEDVVEIVDMTIGGGRVYVTTAPTRVYSVDLEPGMPYEMATLATEPNTFFSGIHGSSNRVCFAQHEPPAVRCIDTDNNAELPQSVTGFPANSLPTNLVFDATDVYVTVPTSEAIYASELSGVIDVIAGGQLGLGEIAIDDGTLYWANTNISGDGRLLRWALGALPDSQETWMRDLVDPWGVAVDDTAIYVSDKLGGAIYRCDK